MKDYQLFDLVGLAFDPPERKVGTIKRKIDLKKAELVSTLERETQQASRDAIQAQIDYLDKTVTQILTPDGRSLNDTYLNQLADKKTSEEYNALTVIAKILAIAGVHTVTETSLRHYKKESRLSIEHVRKVFSDAEFEIIDKDPLAAFPKFPTNADRIYSELSALRKTTDPNGADTSVAVDLYSFAAYISNDTGNVALYKTMGTKELWDIFDPASRKYSQRNDDLGKLCGSLAATAKTYVFNSDENREAYERHLVYQSEELIKLFAAMAKMPKETLLALKVACFCIRIICRYFPDVETAISIYCKEANLIEMPKDLYEAINFHISDPTLSFLELINNTADDAFDQSFEFKLTNTQTRPKEAEFFATKDNKKEYTSQVYGIDLGMTYSAIAALDNNGKPEMICNMDEGSDLLASAVYFQDGAYPVVGEIAKDMKDIEPERVVEFVKRYIGKSDAPIYEFEGVKYDPVIISALFLKRMKAYTDAQGHDVKNVVITCPAYFGRAEKDATIQAACIAGLNVMKCIPEPIAATLGYFGTWSNGTKVLVYDLGGGTFDLTLLECHIDDSNGVSIEIIENCGNDRLGGIDWDARMFEYMCEQYAYENGTEISDMDEKLKATIRAQVEKAKKALSILETKRYTIKYDDDRTRIELNRQEFEERTQDLVEQTMDFVHQLLSSVEMSADDVDVVLLVGGSTFMPMIKNAVENLFPGKVMVDQPNLAVAKGAALSAAIKWNVQEPKIIVDDSSIIEITDPIFPISEIQSKPVSGEPVHRSYGIGVIKENQYLIDNVITLDMDLPAVGERTFGTSKDNQDIMFSIFESTSCEPFVTPNIDIEGNPQYTDPELKVKRIGEVRLQLPPNTPKGSPIRVVFRSSTVGLEVTAENIETGEIVTVEINPDNGYTADQVAEAKKRFADINTSGQI